MMLTANSPFYLALHRLPGHYHFTNGIGLDAASAAEKFWDYDYGVYVIWNLSGDVICDIFRNGYGGQPTIDKGEMRSSYCEATSCVLS